MRYVPKTIGEVAGHFAVMATDAPKYEQMYNPDGDPEDEFRRTREGLENIKSKIGESAYAYLLARTEENWNRLQTDDADNLRKLKLSFGEMIEFLRVKKYKDSNITSSLADYTEIRYG